MSKSRAASIAGLLSARQKAGPLEAEYLKIRLRYVRAKCGSIQQVQVASRVQATWTLVLIMASARGIVLVHSDHELC